MATRLPFSIKLSRRALARRDAFFASILRAVRPSSAEAGAAVHAFAFKNDEERFARALLDVQSRIWLYRNNQRAFCGDFIAVDMSSPKPAKRRAIVIELKQGAPVRWGGGGAGVQLKNAAEALRDPRGAGAVLGDEAPWEMVSGDAARLLGSLGVSLA